MFIHDLYRCHEGQTNDGGIYVEIRPHMIRLGMTQQQQRGILAPLAGRIWAALWPLAQKANAPHCGALVASSRQDQFRP